MNFIIHHPGKAGEVFMALPAAQLLKKHHPGCHITWVILDLFRDSLGHNQYIDEIEVIPTYSCRNLSDVNSHMSRHRSYVLGGERSIEDHRGIHIDLYYGYIIDRSRRHKWTLNRNPFYLQLFANAAYFCPGTDTIADWTSPEWNPDEQSVAEGNAFLAKCGGGPVIIFSPFISDKTAVNDNAPTFPMETIFETLKSWGLPVVATGSQWDEKVHPEWVMDGYAPGLSLGGLFYLIKQHAALVVTPNSGIGFAAHWLGAPTLMIDNRIGWKSQVADYRAKYPLLADDAAAEERRWPMFMKEYFPPTHLGRSAFEQIEWSSRSFHEGLKSIKARYGEWRQSSPRTIQH